MPTPEWQPYRGVRASAGSGKTYQLTGHYLRALLAGAAAGDLLATTFTRKAAGEILDRVLTRLAGACESDEKRQTLAADLNLPNLDENTVRAEMQRLCQSLDEVSISTIDALFSRLLSGYRHELGIADGVRMETPESPEMLRLRQEAAADLLAGAYAAQVGGLLDTLAEGEPGRSVIGNILAWVGRGYELFTTVGTDAWELDLGMDAPLTEPEVEQSIAAIEAFSGHANGNIRKAINGNLDAAREGEWPAFLDKGFAKPLLTENPTFYSKPVPADIALAYAPLIAHAQAEIAARHLKRHYALRDLLALYDDAYRERREQAGVLLFSDVPLLLASIIPRQTEGGADYRLGCAPRHLLLDEFQDTDPRQYAVLKPFAAAATLGHELGGGGGSLFCVGDRKQSIYGWRGATPELFERIEREIPCLAWDNSDLSYRSSPAILHCVNTLFGALAANAVLSEKAPRVAAEWQSHYHEHTPSRPELAGYAELIQYAPDTLDQSDSDSDNLAAPDLSLSDASEKAGPSLRQAAAKIKAVRDAAPGRSLAVLTRTNDAVRTLLPLLDALGVPAASESGSPIDDSPATLLVLAALAFADHPGDTAARFQILNSPLAEPLGLSGENALDPPEAALRIRAALSALGIAGVIGVWTRTLAPHTDRRGFERLTQLVEMADEYDAQHPGWHRPAEFVAWARAQVREPLPGEGGENPVRVMTVHKSKGLEFDAVVLPELSKYLLRPEPMVTLRDKYTQEIAALTLRPDKAAQACCPLLAELAQESADQQISESLCLLYVALTRARYALHLLVPPLGETSTGKVKAPTLSLAAILRAGLTGEAALSNTTLPQTLWQHGHPDWHNSVPLRDIAPPAPPKTRPAPAIDTATLPPHRMQFDHQKAASEDNETFSAAQLLNASTVEPDA